MTGLLIKRSIATTTKNGIGSSSTSSIDDLSDTHNEPTLIRRQWRKRRKQRPQKQAWPCFKKLPFQNPIQSYHRVVTLLFILGFIVFFLISTNNNGIISNDSSTTATATATTPTTSKQPIPISELQHAKNLLLDARNNHKLKPLRPIDKEKYTVRINTWRRNEQLMTSLRHLITCEGIAHIVIVWCDMENDPPIEIKNMVTGVADDDGNGNENDGSSTTRVTHKNSPVIEIEYHSVNSLNERFHVIHKPMTYGILSIDDDVLRPCIALDDGFFRWTDHPDRMVGYDYRTHIVHHPNKTIPFQKKKAEESTITAAAAIATTIYNDHNKQKQQQQQQQQQFDKEATIWSYGYLSDTRKRNEYSMVLPRFSFIHADYLNLYMTHLPPRILQTVDTNFNCEDIAMSFFISSLTYGKVPLLANHWSMLSMVKLKSSNAISHSSNHKTLRDSCVDDFSFLLGLKDGYASITNQSQSESQLRTRYKNDSMIKKDKQPWRMLKPQKIWNGKKVTLFGIGKDVQLHPFQILNDFVPRRKKFVEKTKQWAYGNGSFVDLHKDLAKKIKALGLLAQ